MFDFLRSFDSLERTAKRHLILTGLFGLFGLCFLLAGIFMLAIALTPSPDIASFGSRQVDQSTKIYDRTGQVLLYDYNRDARRDVVPLSEISPNAINAVIAIEDSSFYEHGGIRLSSILRAIIVDAFGGSLSQGGSTITQQVVKNTLLTNRKSVSRKIHEWILAIKLEQKYSKDQILETYMNDMPFGGTLYGIEAASEAYYGIPAKDLSLAQAAYLAAMLQAPSYYSPTGSHKDALDTREQLVLERMHTLGFIDDQALASAKAEKVSFAPAGASTILAPHFVFYILNQLEDRYGSNALVSGLKVTTTLDADLQAHAESIIADAAPTILANDNASNEAEVALDPSTGEILSMVGSSDFFSKTTDGQYNATLALRQPGSTMKPFIYSLALERGYTRDTVVFDVPTQFSTACRPEDVGNSTPPCYAPVDFDDAYRGPMTFETALAQSINIPAIKVLYLVGIQNAINLAESMGLTTLGDASQYGLTLVLGGGEVRLLDLAGAYAGFASGGVVNTPTGILEVDDAQGNVLTQYAPSPRRVLPENIANDMNAMLSDNPARVPEYSLNSPLYFPGYDVAVKTGTTDDTRDAWVVGYTPSIVIGTWAGNNDNSPMKKSIAGLILAPSWHQIMAYALTKYPKTYFGEADPIPASVPPMLQGNWRVPDANNVVAPHSLLYWTDKNDPQGAPPRNASSDPQYPYWEYGVANWYATHPESFYGGVMLPVPLSYGETVSSSTGAY
ncbi:MAG TPA: transglycosylase domain-containing protein [Candidatus Paceibacterota bacterium]|nr:transglycosylase domain-containing protein [Candidatus Paceibacterota bacterium]